MRSFVPGLFDRLDADDNVQQSPAPVKHKRHG